MGNGQTKTRSSDRPVRTRMRQAMLFKSRWGWMGISESGKGINRIVLPQTSKRRALAALREPASGVPVMERSSQLEQAQAQMLDYLAGTRQTFDVPVDLSQGTAFQRRVWRTLLRVPYGKLRSYQWVAARVGGRQYARAVGNAVGANPLPIVVPCHRIVAHDASLGGFSGGLPTKRKLLTLEGTLAQLQHGRT